MIFRALVLALLVASPSCQNTVVFPSEFATNRLSAEQRAALVPTPIRVKLGNSFGWFFKANSGDDAMMMFHGNAETVDDYADWATQFARSGVSVLLVEFPGYREAKGAAGQSSIRKVAIAGYDWLHFSGYAHTNITLFGRSVGAGAACDLTKFRDIEKLVLVSPFSSLGEAAKRAGFPKFLAFGKFDNVKAMESYTGELLVIHGRHDEMLPLAMGKELVARAGSTREDKSLLSLEAGHNDLVSRHRAEITSRILTFIHKSRGR